jgi:hypothetical protein
VLDFDKSKILSLIVVNLPKKEIYMRAQSVENRQPGPGVCVFKCEKTAASTSVVNQKAGSLYLA